MAMHFCNVALNMNGGVEIVVTAAAPGSGLGTLPPCFQRFSASCFSVSVARLVMD